MSGFNGSGNFSFTYLWTNDAANGIPITASRMDTQFGDAQGGFDLVICRDGQSTTTNLIPFSFGLSTGAGIQFPTPQIPSSDPNNLDDYAEAIFTPVVEFGGASVGVTYTKQAGKYTKIGNSVSFTIEIVLSNKGSSTGNLSISLPLANSSTAAVAVSLLIDDFALSGSPFGQILASGQEVFLYGISLGQAGAIDNTNVTDTAMMVISGTYFV